MSRMKKNFRLPIAALCEGHQIIFTVTDLPDAERSRHLAGRHLTVVDGHGILHLNVTEVYGSRPPADQEEWQGRTLFVRDSSDYRIYILNMPSDQKEIKCLWNSDDGAI